MNNNACDSSEYKNGLFTDIYFGKTPARVPDKIGVNAAAAIELAGYDLRYAQYGYTKTIDALDKINAKYDNDILLGTWPASPALAKVRGNLTQQMGADGFMQHPNICGMHEDEYDELLADPLAFIWETVIPRINTEFDTPAPYRALVMAKTIKLLDSNGAKMGAANAEIAKKYNKVTMPLQSGLCRAPFDYFADYLRSFTGALVDIRRQPEKVLEALEAITPLIVKAGRCRHVQNKSKLNRVFFALHMPTYMKPKDFAGFWWPSFEYVVKEVDAEGLGLNIFCEENWSPYLEYLLELPELCALQFEYGDPKTIKKTLGERHIIEGMFPVNLLKSASFDEIEAKTKEMLDIMAPDGQYIFNLDKSVLRARQINWDNFDVLIHSLRKYGSY